MGTEFLFEMLRMFWKWTVVMAASTVQMYLTPRYHMLKNGPNGLFCVTCVLPQRNKSTVPSFHYCKKDLLEFIPDMNVQVC